MINIKSVTIAKLLISLFAHCVTQNVIAQTSSPNIINQRGTPILTRQYNSMSIQTLEDWHYGGVETEDGGFVFTTRIEQSVNALNGHQEFPGLIKYDKYFNVQWHQFLKPGKYAKIAPFGFPAIIDSAIIEGAEIHTKVIETNDGFLAFGYYYLGSKIFVLKVDKEGNVAPNFPRIFDYYSTYNYQINDIVHVNTNNFTGYIGVGHKNNQMAIFQFDEQLENLTTTMLGNGTNITGEIFGLCLLFSSGSSSRDMPKIKNEHPTGIAFTGWSDNGDSYPTFVRNFNVYYGAANLSLSTINFYKLKHYSNPSSQNSSIPQFGDLSILPATPNPALTYNFKGYDICQTKNGNIGGLELWNYMFFSGSTTCSTERKNGTGPSGADQLIAGDIYVRELKFDPVNFTLDTFLSGTTQVINNYGHASGSDYYPRIALDLDDDFIVLTNNTDHPTTVTNHYFLQKIDRSSHTQKWGSIKLGIGPSGICPFELLVTKNGRYITAGNNYNTSIFSDNEDLDIALWGSPCQANAVNNANEFISNVPNGHDFSLQQWSMTTPGNPTTMQIGGSGIVGSRIIVEPGYTLKFLGGQNVNLQFPHVEEFGNGIAYSGQPMKNIVVEPGGKVIIENGVVLRGIAECNSSWEGIELKSSVLGGVKAELLMGSAEIKDAITAIKTNAFSKISIGSSLGNDAKFTNCRTGIEMYNDNYSTSKIIKSIFHYTKPIETGFNEGLENHIYLDNMNGLNIWGSQFINSDASSNVISGTYRGTGIKAINSNFNVLKNQLNVYNSETKKCQPPLPTEPPCIFQSLSIGIDAVYLIPTYYTGYRIKVLNNRFINCRHAMHFANGNNITVFENEIFVEDTNLGQEPIYQLDGNYGITMNGVSQFQIIQNKIQINDLGRFSHGISIINSDYISTTGNSVIYQNETTAQTFQNNKNIALKVSESSSNLKIECNTNTNISTDWVFNPFTNITQIGTTNVAAGNLFSKEGPCVTSPSDAIDWYVGELINYWDDGRCTIPQRAKPHFQSIPGFPPISPNVFPSNKLNACKDSISCHVSRWTSELSVLFSGSIAYFPPIPPPNKDINDQLIKGEQNRISNGIPLIDDNSFIPINSDNNGGTLEFYQNGTYQIYPNPVSLENPTLSFSNILIPDVSINIYNSRGQEIKFENIDNHSILLKNVSQGFYIAKILINDQTFSTKLFITQ
ncbi:MAG: Secretion system C-terminal sorting domain [Bacteroidota bacterium]|jgi:hypothetical protein